MFEPTPGQRAPVAVEGSPARPGPVAVATPTSLAALSHQIPIEMYTATWCGTCNRARAWLEANHIDYRSIDIDRASMAREQLALLNPARSIPTFDIEGQVYVGFEPGRIEAMIRTAAQQ